MDADAWRQAKGVLAEALLCPPDERDALVVERCPDPRLRSEVQAYLHEYDENFLESVLTVSNTFDQVTPADAEDVLDVQPGEEIGPYVVLERLGVGGMGQVFLANDTRLHRRVALKCLLASGPGGDLRSRILHEARAAARINHPNIAVVHDVIDYDGHPFLVMEYVKGETLASVLRRERPPIGTILVIGRQLASALAAAHAEGIVHRDLKPANIQVMPDGAVKILDFGVAQAMSMLATDAPPRTPPDARPASASVRGGGRGAVAHPGTPAYMSPEQMFGREIDQRSDIYSLGVVMYEMATGERPYSVDDPLDVVLALSRSLLRPPGAETNLSPDVSRVVWKMLAVKPEERFQTATELETALLALIGSDPAAASLARPRVRSRVRTAIGVASVLLLVPVAIGILGFLVTTFFNHFLGRTAPFDAEPPAVWLKFGMMSLTVRILSISVIALLIWILRSMVRTLRLSRRVNSLLTTGADRTRRLTTELRLHDPAVFAQVVAMLGVVGLTLVIWRFWNVVASVLIVLPVYPDIDQRVGPLRPTSAGSLTRELYRVALDVLVVVFSGAIFRIVRTRRDQFVRRGTVALLFVIALLTVTVLMSAVPYRVMWQNQFERVSFAGDRCYAIGQTGDEWMLFCPGRRPPRNQVVKRADPGVRRSGIFESIFTLPEASH